MIVPTTSFDATPTSCAGSIREFQSCPLGESAHNGLGLQEQFSFEVPRVKNAHETKRRIKASGAATLRCEGVRELLQTVSDQGLQRGNLRLGELGFPSIDRAESLRAQFLFPDRVRSSHPPDTSLLNAAKVEVVVQKLSQRPQGFLWMANQIFVAYFDVVGGKHLPAASAFPDRPFPKQRPRKKGPVPRSEEH